MSLFRSGVSQSNQSINIEISKQLNISDSLIFFLLKPKLEQSFSYSKTSVDATIPLHLSSRCSSVAGSLDRICSGM